MLYSRLNALLRFEEPQRMSYTSSGKQAEYKQLKKVLYIYSLRANTCPNIM